MEIAIQIAEWLALIDLILLSVVSIITIFKIRKLYLFCIEMIKEYQESKNN